MEVEHSLYNASLDMDKDSSYLVAFAGSDKIADIYHSHLYDYKIDYIGSAVVVDVADAYYNCCRSYYKLNNNSIIISYEI
jgi:hypothetical protein